MYPGTLKRKMKLLNMKGKKEMNQRISVLIKLSKRRR